MNGFLLTRGKLLIPILSTLLLSVQWVLKKTKADFLRYVGYRNYKRPYKARFIANSCSCTTTILSKLLTLCLTAVKKHWIRYYDTVYERDGINYFGQLQIPMKFSINLNLKLLRLLNCLHNMIFLHYIPRYYLILLPHHLIKDKLTDLINWTFTQENTQYLACNE